MVWNTVHDEMLCREILVVDPFTGTKKGTVERGTQWEEVALPVPRVSFDPFPLRPKTTRFIDVTFLQRYGTRLDMAWWANQTILLHLF